MIMIMVVVMMKMDNFQANTIVFERTYFYRYFLVDCPISHDAIPKAL